jgi:hypothetical protein
VKYQILAATAAAFLYLTGVGETRPVTHKPEPKIVKQESGGSPERVMLTIRNPLARAVWVYIECPNVFTEEPVGIEGRRTVKVNLACPSDPGAEPCVVNHWTIQDAHDPKPWLP